MKILNHLHLTLEQYNTLLFDTYFSWCIAKAANDYDLQQLLANRKMYAWFMVQINGLEQDFLIESTPYLSLKNSDGMVKLWKKSIMKIYIYYSVPLLNVARKTTIINEIQAHDIISTRN